MVDAAADPFLVVKEEVEASIKNAKSLYERWQALYNDKRADEDEFKWTTKELRTTLKGIEWDLDDLGETVAIVEREPERFNLPASEIEARKRFIRQTGEMVKEYVAATSPQRIKARNESESRDALLGSSKYSRYEKLEKEIQDDNQGFIDDQHQTQTMIMREQDQQLSEVGQTIGVLKQMGTMIGDELDDQADLLEDMDNEMTSTSDRLTGVLKKLDKTLNITRDGKQSCLICLLLIILMILIIVYVT
eukprot:TRINITY_DN6181_c0_g1_i3.p1 TRINITY_DN6181_c0_g1~~TRINITY_DN6181_c0_g1_i3.p1  ORF type:complete len:248 (+),score=52.04 TRINITY_DN6181_c0_g1_i3:100-843(+)